MGRRRRSHPSRLMLVRAAQVCREPAARERPRVAFGRAAAVRSPPHSIRVPRRRAHVGDGRGWSPVRSAR